MLSLASLSHAMTSDTHKCNAMHQHRLSGKVMHSSNPQSCRQAPCASWVGDEAWQAARSSVCDSAPGSDARLPHSPQIKDLGCKAGVVLNPATPLSAIENVLSFVGALLNPLSTPPSLTRRVVQIHQGCSVAETAVRTEAYNGTLRAQQPLMSSSYVCAADLVLIMSVNPGFGGQKFIAYQVDKIKKLRAMCNAVVSPHAAPRRTR